LYSSVERDLVKKQMAHFSLNVVHAFIASCVVTMLPITTYTTTVIEWSSFRIPHRLAVNGGRTSGV